MLRVTATDRDMGPNAMLFYYITAGNQDLTFRMDRVTGEMVTRPAPPDRERQQEYTLVVTVEDDGTPPLSVRAACSVCSSVSGEITNSNARHTEQLLGSGGDTDPPDKDYVGNCM